MDRPRPISSSGEARAWNEDVERRRIAHHQRRCAEDAMYRKAYEYQLAEERRMQEQMSKSLVQIADVMDAERQQRINSSTEGDEKQPKEAVCKRPTMDEYMRRAESGRTDYFSRTLGLGILATMLADHGKLMQRMKEMDEMKPYLDEISETDKRFGDEKIQLSGFEW